MEQRKDELWQGGPWEQPSPSFPTPPPVHIPVRKKTKKPRRKRRPVLVFCAILALICGLTAAAVHLSGSAPWEKPERPGVSRLPDKSTETEAPELTLPRAETGTGVTVTISPLPEEKLTYTQVYEKNEQSIVTVHAMDSSGVGQGTGIVLTQDGYIITNAHVIEGAAQAVVVLGNDMTYDAKLVGSSPEEDLAVLKVEAQDLVPAEFGDSFPLRVGDEVSALGNPLGYRMSMTPGIISAVDRKLVVDGNTMYLLQTSAAINFGNSGGALFNDRGQVVGVTAVKVVSDDGSTEGLGFAIPTERVKYVVDHLIAGEEMKVPMLGITVQQSHERNGLAVIEIQSWSDALGKGIQVGDTLLTANGYALRTNRDLERIKNLQRVGDTLNLQVERDGQRLEYQVVLQDMD